MSKKKNNDSTNNKSFLNYEFSSIPYESLTRDKPPFVGNNPFAKGGFIPPGMPKSAPPNYLPSKNDVGVQNLSKNQNEVTTKAVSSNSIRFCLFKFTYIWETNGRSYWTFLVNVDRVSVSGFRWLGRNWVYFGLDLKRIDSFVCYNRSDSNDTCDKCEHLRYNNRTLENTKKEYSLNATKDVYTQTLASIDIPEVKEDFITQTIGYVEDSEVTSEIPCIKSRNVSYKITLELTYPSHYNNDLKNKINELANDSINDAYRIISSTRNTQEYLNPLEIFNASILLIPKSIDAFSEAFNDRLQQLNLSVTTYNDINYCIRQEKIENDWKIDFYNDAL